MPVPSWRLAVAPGDVRPGDTITYPDALDRAVTAAVDRTTPYAAWVTRFGAASAIPWYRVTASAPAA
jgi:hypothetical protein